MLDLNNLVIQEEIQKCEKEYKARLAAGKKVFFKRQRSQEYYDVLKFDKITKTFYIYRDYENEYYALESDLEDETENISENCIVDIETVKEVFKQIIINKIEDKIRKNESEEFFNKYSCLDGINENK